jgi:AraC family transcriptional regulator
MEPKIVTLGPIYLVGIPYFGSPDGGEFVKAWDRFRAERGKVANRADPKVYYGLAVYGPEFLHENKWTYMPSVQVIDLSETLSTLFAKVLPACTYAVFTASGVIENIIETNMQAYHGWLPDSDYEIAHHYDFELFDDDRFHGGIPGDEIDIYIPIKKKVGGS